MGLGERIRQKRKEQKLTQTELSKLVNVSSQVISNWERGYTDPNYNDVIRLADALKVSADYLLGKTTIESSPNDDLPKLSSKDERDIAKDLEAIIYGLENKDGYSHFDGQSIEDMDEEDRELLIASLENSMRIAKRLAKKKFTPKKYRDKE